MHRAILLLLPILALAACTTMTPAERRALDEAECRSYGFRDGTDAFAACLQRIELDRRAAARADRAAFDRWAATPSVIYRPVFVPVDRD